MSGRFKPPFIFLSASLVVYAVLAVFALNGVESPWIDRIIVGEIALTAGYAVYAMFSSTFTWTVRGLGIWGLLLAIVLLYGTSQLVEWGFVPSPTPWFIRNTWRSMLAVAGPCMLYGYYYWRKRKECTVECP